MKRCIHLIILFIFLTGNAQNETLFERGNSAYSEGEYIKAVEIYSEIFQNGEESAALHYNLANAYYKLDRVGPSIYHYEKALQLKPGDQDVINNLEFARNMIIDSFNTSQDSSFTGLIDSRTTIFTPSEWGWTAIACMLIFVGFFLAYYFSGRTVFKRIFFIVGILFLFLSITSAGIGTLKQNILDGQLYGIVFSEEIQVRSEPNSRSTEIFTLHEGTKVKVTEDFQGWYEIEMPNGTQGWISDQSIRLL